MSTAFSSLSVGKNSALTSQESHSASADVAAPSTRVPLGKSFPASEQRYHQVVHAIEGNHVAIQGLLQRVLYRPSPAEFGSAVLRPDYTPAERLLIKRPSDRRLVAHLQLQPQTVRFGQVMVPALRLRDLAVLAEYEVRGFSDQMVLAAEQDALRSGAMILMACGLEADVFERRGWAALGRDPVSIVSPQRLLGQLPAPREPETLFNRDAIPRPEVRLGRLTDVDALQRLYEKKAVQWHGPPVRDDDYWAWLVARRAHDRMFLYTENGEPSAYVVVRGASVIELVDLTVDNRGAARLLKRVGADAIEQGRHALKIHAPVTDPVHRWSEMAGGQLFFAPQESEWRARIVSHRKLLRRLGTELHRRYDARLPREIGLRIDNEDLLLRPGVRTIRVTRGASGKHRLCLTNQAATQLFLGVRDAEDLATDGQLMASSAKALDAARQLFPIINSWRPRWDDVPVMDS